MGDTKQMIGLLLARAVALSPLEEKLELLSQEISTLAQKVEAMRKLNTNEETHEVQKLIYTGTIPKKTFPNITGKYNYFKPKDGAIGRPGGFMRANNIFVPRTGTIGFPSKYRQSRLENI